MKRFTAALGALALLVAPLSLEAADDTLKRDRFGNPVSAGTNGADEIRVMKVNDDGSLDITIISGGGGGTVDQGTSGVDTDPWNFVLRKSDGTELGTSADPIRTDPTGTTTQPVAGTASDGAAAVGAPVQTGGKTSAGTMQTFLTDGNGAQVFASDQTGADNVANSDIAGVITPPGTTVRRLGVATYYLDAGGAWDRTRGNETDGALVNLGTNNDVVIQDTAGSPGSIRLSDGTVFYKATTPSDTQLISAAVLPLPAGAATETTLSSVDTDTSTIAGDTTSIDGKTPALGQAASAASVPVVFANDQSKLDVQGVDADGAPATADPVQIGGKDISGNIQTMAVNPNGVIVLGDPVSSPGDGISNTNVLTRIEDVNGTAAFLGVVPIYFNNTSWDRVRGNAFGAFSQGPIVEGGVATGFPLRMAGWDGTDVYTLKTDVDGHLQIDVLTNLLPTDAATETTLAAIDADTSALFGTVAGSEQQVDIVAALPAGTNNIGNVTVNNAGAGAAVNIQDGGNLISIDDGAGTLTVDDGGTTLSVDDGAGSLTVDGTITADIGTTGGLSLETTQTDVELNTDSATVFGSTTVTVGSTATLILAADVNRRSALIRNADNNTILFTGPTSGVTTANGMPIAISGVPGATGNGGTIIYTHTAAIWGIVTTGTADIRVQTESD